MINSIELVNWKTHSSTRLSFAKGTNILIGQMGAGKSSVMDAISFGLFGTFPSIGRAKVSELIKNRPEQKRSAKLRLSFDVNGDSYLVEREISLKEPGKATLEKNGAYLQSQPERVTQEIEKVLKMNYDLFSRAVYSEQNRLDYFLDLTPGDRKKKIDNLLGLDKFANAKENTTTLISRIKEMIKESEKTAEVFDLEGQKRQLARLQSEKEKLGEEKKAALEAVKTLKSGLKEMESRLKEAKERYNKKLLIEKEIGEAKSRISVIENEIRKIEAEKLGELNDIGDLIKSKEARLGELKAKEDEISARMQRIQKSIGKAESEISSIAKEEAEKEKLLDSVKGKERGKVSGQLEKHKEELEELDGELASAMAQKEEARRWIKELEKHISKCPVCERDLDIEMKNGLVKTKKALERELDEKAERLQQTQKGRRREMEELNALLNRLTVVEDRIKGYSGLEERKKKAEGEIERLKEESLKAKSETGKMGDDADKLNKELSRLMSAKEALERRVSYISDLKKINELVGKREKELGETDVDQKKVDGLQKEFTAASSELSGKEASFEAIAKSFTEKDSQIGERKLEIEKVEKIYEDVKAKKAVIDNLTKFGNSLQETQALLRSRLVTSINRVMQQIWPELYPYGDYPSLELDATEGDYTLRISTYREGKEVMQDVDAVASGGERSIASLAMRVAFALILVPNLKWLILDEPTHNIDQLGIERFVRVFNEKLPEIVDQIFIITHDEQLKQVSNGKIYMLSRKKEKGGETVAEEL